MIEKNEISRWILENDILKFGDFILKSGRKSDYFFNLGVVYKGSFLADLSSFYVSRIVEELNKLPESFHFDVIFGPAYKGIPLSISIVNYLWYIGKRNVSYCFNRKEEKTHGDSGIIVGSSLKNKNVLIVDDVITSGSSIIESIEILKLNGSNPVAVVVFVDRMESVKDGEKESASSYLFKTYKIPILSVLTIKDIVESPYVVNSFPEKCCKIKKMLVN